MKKAIFSLAIIAAAAAVIIGGTTAFFSDTETSEGNVFTAGAIDLKIDNDSYYNGLVCADVGDGIYKWQGNVENPDYDSYMKGLIGAPCALSWQAKDLEPGNLFFDFEDVKPGDWGEDTISLIVDNNDAWACMDININTEGLADKDLAFANTIQFVWWADDGDNVLETDEYDSLRFAQGPASEVLNSSYALADSGNNVWGEGPGTPLKGEETYYIAKAWCFGELGFDPVQPADNSNPQINPGITCNGAPVNNDSQNGTFSVDVSFYAIQSRHNAGFVCEQRADPLLRYTADLENKDAKWDIIEDDIYGELSYTSVPGSNKLVGKVKGFNLYAERKYQITLNGPGPCTETDHLLAAAGVNLFESGYWNNNVNLEAVCGTPGEGVYNMGVTDGTVNYYTVETDSNGDFVYDFEITALSPGTYGGVKVIVKLLMEPWQSPWVDNSDTANSNIMETAPISFIIN